MEYPKIHSLWKRVGKTNNLIPGDYAQEEFSLIKIWRVSEKIDGMNIRILFDGYNTVEFKGRWDNSIIPADLDKHLKEKFTLDIMRHQFPLANVQVILFGEGYGPKIASGGRYRSDQGFILFDAKVGKYWLNRDSVEDIAKNLQIPVVPDYGFMTEQEIVDLVKSKPKSQCSLIDNQIEGIVARTDPTVHFRGSYYPVMFKLRCEDM